MPTHSPRLTLEDRVHRMAVAARYCADLADHQGLSATSERLEDIWAELLQLSSALLTNRQPRLWSAHAPGPELQSERLSA